MKLMQTIQQINPVYWLAVFGSLLLSAWINYHETVINPDAICYLLSADEMGRMGLTSAMQICPQAKWPFYSVLVFLFGSITHFSLTLSAYAVDALFSVISVCAFITIVKQMGGSRRVLWFAAFVILFAHEFNSVRQYIIRDHGFWACYLLAVSFLIRFFEHPRWKNALAFSISMALATLFRIEGAIFFVLMPFTAFFIKTFRARRYANFIKLYLPILLAAAAIILWVVINPGQAQHKLNRFAEIQSQLTHGLHNISWRYHSSLSAMITHVLPQESAREAGMLWMITIFAGYLWNIVSNLSPVCALLAAYAFYARLAPLRRPVRTILFAAIVLNLMITGIFYAQHIFLSKRYLIALSLLLLLWVPFALAHLQLHAVTWRSRAVYYLAVLLIAASSMGVLLNMGPSKSHIRQAGDWLAVNLPPGVSLYTNDYQLMYYSQQFGAAIFRKSQDYKKINLKAGEWKQFDYLALRTGRRDQQQLTDIMQQLSPVKIFENNRGGRVFVFKVSREENAT